MTPAEPLELNDELARKLAAVARQLQELEQLARQLGLGELADAFAGVVAAAVRVLDAPRR